MIPVVLYFNHTLLCHYGILKSGTPNPFARLILPSGRLENGYYVKTWWDFAFLATYVVFWSLYVGLRRVHSGADATKRQTGGHSAYPAPYGQVPGHQGPKDHAFHGA